jgi:hypothetical protein
MQLHDVVLNGNLFTRPEQCYKPNTMVSCDRCKDTHIACFVHYSDLDVCRKCAFELIEWLKIHDAEMDFLQRHALDVLQSALKQDCPSYAYPPRRRIDDGGLTRMMVAAVQTVPKERKSTSVHF